MSSVHAAAVGRDLIESRMAGSRPTRLSEERTMTTIRKRYKHWVDPGLIQHDDTQFVLLRFDTTQGQLIELEITVPALHELIERLSAIDRLKHRPPGEGLWPQDPMKHG
jgi:hypothetical protein